MIHQFPAARSAAPESTINACEHRSVAADGRIVCKKIVRGENRVGLALCRACPFQHVDCAHLRFSLRHVDPSPLVVRFNGRTEVWNDSPPSLQFEQAACAAQVLPIASHAACAACPLRLPLAGPADAAATTPRPAARRGKVVPFQLPDREPVAAAG